MHMFLVFVVICNFVLKFLYGEIDTYDINHLVVYVLSSLHFSDVGRVNIYRPRPPRGHHYPQLHPAIALLLPCPLRKV